MDDDETQQFSLRWHNHQNSVISALGRMLSTGALADVTLNASGTSFKAHKLVLASCSQYFDQLFKETEAENNTFVVVLGCEALELKLLLTFMYTGEVTASKRNLPVLLRLAHTLKVSGLTDADPNSNISPEINDSYKNLEQGYSPINLENDTVSNHPESIVSGAMNGKHNFENMELGAETKDNYSISNFRDVMDKNEKYRLSKLDQIVQNLYSTHKISTSVPRITSPSATVSLRDLTDSEGRKWRSEGSVCSVCHKRLSNQYNLRVHMETHAGRKHACRACTHVSRSRDALRKHVAYRHAAPSIPHPANPGFGPTEDAPTYVTNT